MEFFKYVKQEIAVIKDRDPAIKSTMEVFLYPSFHAILKYRKAHKLYLKKHYYRARRISQKTARKTCIEIHPGAQIGEGLFIDHGHGVVIGETAIIGDNVTLYQGVTLGGTGKESGQRHPTVWLFLCPFAKVKTLFDCGFLLYLHLLDAGCARYVQGFGLKAGSRSCLAVTNTRHRHS